MVIWFMTEFIARVWSAGCRSRYQSLSGRVQFVRRPFCIVGKFTLLFLQGVSIASYAEPCISYSRHVCPSFRLSVCPSGVRHMLALCQNDAS